jgi:hypothetical protein
MSENGETKPELLPLTPEEAYIILRDGRDMTGQMVDGATETVKVWFVSQADYSAYAQCVVTGQELSEIGFYTRKDAEWIKNMTPWFFDAVLEEGQRLNFPHLTKSLQRRLKRMELIGKANPQMQMVMARMESTLTEQFTPSSSPKDTGKRTSGPTPQGN